MKIILYCLLIGLSLSNSINQTEKKGQPNISLISDTILVKQIAKLDTVKINEYYYSVDTVLIDTSALSVDKFNTSIGINIWEIADSLKVVNETIQKKIHCFKYFSNNTFSKDFNTLILYNGELEGDGATGLVLFNITSNGKILSNLILTSESGWENGEHEMNFEFINDSTLKTIKELKGRDVDSTGEYLLTWSTYIIDNYYKISSDGFIYKIDSDTIIDANYLKFSDFISKNFYDSMRVRKIIKYPINIKLLDSKTGLVDTIKTIHSSKELPWGKKPYTIDYFNPEKKHISAKTSSFGNDSAIIYYEYKEINFGFIFTRKVDWKLVEIFGNKLIK